jgi:hypothetical protein
MTFLIVAIYLVLTLYQVTNDVGLDVLDSYGFLAPYYLLHDTVDHSTFPQWTTFSYFQPCGSCGIDASLRSTGSCDPDLTSQSIMFSWSL